MAETKIIYHMDEEETPYLVKLPVAPERVTLADFKNVLSNRPVHAYKFFFKSMDQDFGSVAAGAVRAAAPVCARAGPGAGDCDPGRAGEGVGRGLSRAGPRPERCASTCPRAREARGPPPAQEPENSGRWAARVPASPPARGLVCAPECVTCGSTSVAQGDPAVPSWDLQTGPAGPAVGGQVPESL